MSLEAAPSQIDRYYSEHVRRKLKIGMRVGKLHSEDEGFVTFIDPNSQLDRLAVKVITTFFTSFSKNDFGHYFLISFNR